MQNILTILLLLAATTEQTPIPTPREATTAELTPWKTQLDTVHEQLDALDLLSLASRFGGITINIPKELQKLPVTLIDKEGELAKRDIQLYLKQITLQDIAFDKTSKEMWLDQAPILPALAKFKRLGITADAQTKLGRFPLGATFKDGQLPFDFILNKDGYDLGLMPERRKNDTHLENVDLQLGGPLASALASKLLGQEIGKLLLTYGMNQTLKMDQGALSEQNTASKLLGIQKGSPQDTAVNTLLDLINKQ